MCTHPSRMVARGRVGIVPVAAQLRRRPQADLADLTRRHGRSVGIADLDLHAGPRSSDGEQRLVVAGVERRRGADAAGLGRRVADRVRGADPRSAPRARARAATSAPPITIVLTADRSKSSKSGSRSSSASCGATPPMLGMRLSAIRRSTSCARQRSITCTVLAVRRYHGSLVMNPTWASCVPDSIGAPPPQRPPVSASVTAASSRAPNTAPFGTPVVPEVRTMVTTPVGIGRQRGGASPAWSRRRPARIVVDPVGPLHRLDRRVARAGPRPARGWPARGRGRRRRPSRRARDRSSGGSVPTVTAPSLASAA